MTTKSKYDGLLLIVSLGCLFLFAFFYFRFLSYPLDVDIKRSVIAGILAISLAAISLNGDIENSFDLEEFMLKLIFNAIFLGPILLLFIVPDQAKLFVLIIDLIIFLILTFAYQVTFFNVETPILILIFYWNALIYSLVPLLLYFLGLYVIKDIVNTIGYNQLVNFYLISFERFLGCLAILAVIYGRKKPRIIPFKLFKSKLPMSKIKFAIFRLIFLVFIDILFRRFIWNFVIRLLLFGLDFILKCVWMGLKIFFRTLIVSEPLIYFALIFILTIKLISTTKELVPYIYLHVRLGNQLLVCFQFVCLLAFLTFIIRLTILRVFYTNKESKWDISLFFKYCYQSAAAVFFITLLVGLAIYIVGAVGKGYAIYHHLPNQHFPILRYLIYLTIPLIILAIYYMIRNKNVVEEEITPEIPIRRTTFKWAVVFGNFMLLVSLVAILYLNIFWEVGTHAFAESKPPNKIDRNLPLKKVSKDTIMEIAKSPVTDSILNAESKGITHLIDTARQHQVRDSIKMMDSLKKIKELKKHVTIFSKGARPFYTVIFESVSENKINNLYIDDEKKGTIIRSSVDAQNDIITHHRRVKLTSGQHFYSFEKHRGRVIPSYEFYVKKNGETTIDLDGCVCDLPTRPKY